MAMRGPTRKPKVAEPSPISGARPSPPQPVSHEPSKVQGANRAHPPASRDRLTLRAEGYRKVIHVASAALPALVWILPRPAALALLGATAGAALAIEAARRYIRPFRYAFLRGTRYLLRARERAGLSGATWMAIAYLVAAIVFPLPVAVAAMLYNAFGDGLAAMVGKRWGRHRIPGGKSIEGAAAGFAANFFVGLAVPGIPLPAALIGGAAAALLEILPIPIDDNVVVTLGGGVVLWAVLGL